MSPRKKRWSSCPSCRALVDPSARACPYCNAVLVGRPTVERQGEERWRLATAAPITTFLLAWIVGLYVVQLLLQQFVLGKPLSFGTGLFDILRPSSRMLRCFGGAGWRENPWWAYFTTNFVHSGGLLHVAFNASFLISLGPLCERILGRWRFILLVFATGFGGMYFAEQAQAGAHMGFSGIACGLLGAMLVFMKRIGEFEAYQKLKGWAIFLAIWSLMPGISWAGHLGGFVIGCLVVFAMMHALIRGLITPRVAAVLGMGSLAGMVLAYLSLGLAVLSAYPYRNYFEVDRTIDQIEEEVLSNPQIPDSREIHVWRLALKRLGPFPEPWKPSIGVIDQALKTYVESVESASGDLRAARLRLRQSLVDGVAHWRTIRREHLPLFVEALNLSDP